MAGAFQCLSPTGFDVSAEMACGDRALLNPPQAFFVDRVDEVALWAAYHHEMPVGKGYPFHATATQIGPEARIIAVADVFKALAQDRPYRKGLPYPRIVKMLQELAEDGHLDSQVVSMVASEPERCWQRATLHSTRHWQ